MNNLYVQVRKCVEQWIKSNKSNFINNNIKIEELENTSEQLYLILHFPKCLAALVVAEPDCAPYRYVSFEVGDIVNGSYEMVYSWYDNENDSIFDILEQLNKGIEFTLRLNNY